MSPRIRFHLPQSYVDFSNYKEPVQTYVDSSTFVMDLNEFNINVCEMNLQQLITNDYPILIPDE